MKFSFVKNKYKFLCIPLAVILAGVIGLVINHGFNVDTDFAGGIKLEVNLNKELDKDALAKQEADAKKDDAAADTAATDDKATDEAATEEATDEAAADDAKAEDAEAEEATEDDTKADEAATDDSADENIYANADKIAADVEPYKLTTTKYTNDEVKAVVEGVANITNVKVQKSGDAFIIKATAKDKSGSDVEQTLLDNVKKALTEKYNLSNAAFESESTTTPTFGSEIRSKALIYTLIALICILLYITIRFEWRSAIMAIIALAINMLVMIAIYGFTQIPLNTTFIAALLTIVGYSINDTIVIFDRIRENTRKSKAGVAITDIVDRSVHECLGRTLSTSITTLITIVLLEIMGVSAIREFALPLIIGVTIGTFTSICFASPFWASWKEADRLAKIEAAKEAAANKKKKK